jgi:hypothetical protein
MSGGIDGAWVVVQDAALRRPRYRPGLGRLRTHRDLFSREGTMTMQNSQAGADANASHGFDQPGLPDAVDPNPRAVPPEYWRAFSVLAFSMNRFIVDHVIRAARQFDNDMETLVLFGMLSHLNVIHLLLPGSSPSATLDERGRVPDPQPRLRPVRIRDLVQITGRPRETIRRKLELLAAAGRVQRVEGGWVLSVDNIDTAMQELTMQSARRFLEVADVMRAALTDAASALRKEKRAINDSGS